MSPARPPEGARTAAREGEGTPVSAAAPLLDRAGIARHLPHAGRMCLLDQLDAWTADTVQCTTRSHLDPQHPLHVDGVLWAPSAIEYAAQAMALHGALVAPPDGPPTPGYIASVRSVRFHARRLDQVPGGLRVHAQRLAGDERQVMYAFRVASEQGDTLAEGRVVVVLNTPLQYATSDVTQDAAPPDQDRTPP